MQVQPGQHIITSHGYVAIVAMVRPNGDVYAHTPLGALPVRVRVRGDAWGGEHDLAHGLAPLLN